MASYVFRKTAAEAAKDAGYKAFRTALDPINRTWKFKYEPGEDALAAWAKGLEWVAWTEVGWAGEEGRRTRVGVAIVSITKPELADVLKELHPDLQPPPGTIFEPQTPSLWDAAPKAPVVAREGRTRAKRDGDDPAPARARSDVESPVKTVWRIADEHKAAGTFETKAVVAACVAAGVNKATASTQVYRWKKANGQ